MIRNDHSTARRLRWLNVVAPLVLAGTVAAQAPSKADDRALLVRRGPGGDLTQVIERGEGYVVSRSFGSELRWTHELDGRPDFLQAETPAGTVVVGRLRNDGGARWAKVITADGQSWSPPGLVRLIHLSKQGDKVLAQVRIDGEPETQVFDARGNRLARFALPDTATHVVQLTARGDAIAVTPGPDDGSSVLEVHEIATGRSHRVQLDEGFDIQDAAALDADHVVVLSGGALTMVHSPDAEEFAAEGPLGWSLVGYWTLLGTTADGERLLATRGFGRFDVVSRDGRVLWSYDPDDVDLARRMPGVDLRQLQPFLRDDGTVLLLDRGGDGYLLRWPASQGDVLAAPRITRQPQAAGNG